MSKVVINFKTDSKLKAEAQKLAAELGISLSTMLNNSLKGFVKNKSLELSTEKPYGVIKGVNITESDIKKIKSSWKNSLNDLV